jgi:hypothetical protein
MSDFRCYMFNVEGEILFGVNIIAETLDTASEHAFELRHAKNENRPPSRIIHAVEVWLGSNRLFPEPTDAWATNRRVAQPIAPAMSRHAFAV